MYFALDIADSATRSEFDTDGITRSFPACRVDTYQFGSAQIDVYRWRTGNLVELDRREDFCVYAAPRPGVARNEENDPRFASVRILARTPLEVRFRTDHYGMQRLCFHDDLGRGRLTLSNSPWLLAALRSQQRTGDERGDEQGIIDVHINAVMQVATGFQVEWTARRPIRTTRIATVFDAFTKTAVRNESIAGLATQLRKAVVESVTTIANESKRTAVLLSGGLDSSTIAAALAIGGSRNTPLIHFVWPKQMRKHETRLARMTARHLGMELREVPFRKEEYFPVARLDQHLAHHIWFGWARTVQRNIASFECVMMGNHGDAFRMHGGFSEVLGGSGYDFLTALRWRGGVLPGLRRVRAVPTGEGGDCPFGRMGFAWHPGQMFKFANPFVGDSAPICSPFHTPAIANIAREATKHGPALLEKLIVRIAFGQNVPKEVADQKRIGTPLPRELLPPGKRALSIAQIWSESVSLTAGRLGLRMG